MSLLGTYTPDNLRAGDFPIVTRPVTLSIGQSVSRGALLGSFSGGAIDTVGEYPITAGMTLRGVALETVDATSAAKACPMALTGEFDSSALSVPEGSTLSDYIDALRDIGIFVVTTQSRT